MNEETPSRFRQAASRWYQAIDSPLAFLVALLSVATLYFAAVDWRVRTLVEDPGFIATVAKHARPGLVFDADGRALADMGALQYLESVPSVEPAPEGEETYFAKITVHPKSFLPSEPILEALDAGPVSVRATRGEGLSWEIRLSSRYPPSIAAGDRPQAVSSPRYRLEIVPPE